MSIATIALRVQVNELKRDELFNSATGQIDPRFIPETPSICQKVNNLYIFTETATSPIRGTAQAINRNTYYKDTPPFWTVRLYTGDRPRTIYGLTWTEIKWLFNAA